LICRIGVLVSGRGSNLRAILHSIRSGYIKNGSVSVVISNRAQVPAIEMAESFGVPPIIIDSSRFTGDKWEYDKLLIEALENHGVDSKNGLVLLAGFDRILSPHFVNHYSNRLMNIHPSLLPSFPGLHAQKQALEYGTKVTGCTVHFVVPEVDAGPIILQRAVRVKDGDTIESLSKRILKQEHKIYPEAVKLFLEGRLKIIGRKVHVL
jgi:phosphoribosylglycinamide formyltransferase-1